MPRNDAGSVGDMFAPSASGACFRERSTRSLCRAESPCAPWLWTFGLKRRVATQDVEVVVAMEQGRRSSDGNGSGAALPTCHGGTEQGHRRLPRRRDRRRPTCAEVRSRTPSSELSRAIGVPWSNSVETATETYTTAYLRLHKEAAGGIETPYGALQLPKGPSPWFSAIRS